MGRRSFTISVPRDTRLFGPHGIRTRRFRRSRAAIALATVLESSFGSICNVNYSATRASLQPVVGRVPDAREFFRCVTSRLRRMRRTRSQPRPTRLKKRRKRCRWIVRRRVRKISSVVCPTQFRSRREIIRGRSMVTRRRACFALTSSVLSLFLFSTFWIMNFSDKNRERNRSHPEYSRAYFIQS